MAKKIPKPKSGDVWATQFANGYWCALVVLESDRTSYVVYTSAYYDLEPPTIDDARLKEFYYEDDYYSDGKRESIYVISGKPDNSYHLVGEIDLEEKSEITESNWYFGIWKGFKPQGLMWEMDPSTKVFPKTVKSKAPEHHVDELPNDVFWEFIESIDLNKKNPMRALVKALKESSVETIYSFEETLSHKLYQLDTPEHAGLSEDYLSPDVFLYARCAVIAQGRGFYETTLRDDSPIDLERDTEELLEVAGEAYEKKTRDFFDFVSTYDYETFSNKEAWQIEEDK